MNLKEVDTELLIQELCDRGYIRVFWNKEDIIFQDRANHVEIDGVELTDEQVSEVVYNIEQSFDANIGVNWDVISEHISEVKGN